VKKELNRKTSDRYPLTQLQRTSSKVQQKYKTSNKLELKERTYYKNTGEEYMNKLMVVTTLIVGRTLILKTTLIPTLKQKILLNDFRMSFKSLFNCKLILKEEILGP
jgi:hypothetical protein